MNKRDFFDGIAEKWEKEHRILREQEKLRNLFACVHLKKGDRVLDVGCGTGRLVPLIREKTGTEAWIVELDFAFEMLKVARRRYGVEKMFFIQSDTEKLPHGERLFDSVVCFALFPHIDDKGRALREYRRVLKSGSPLYIAHTMSREELNSFHSRIKGPVCSDFLPGEREMRRLFSDAGFEGLEIVERPSLYIARARA